MPRPPRFESPLRQIRNALGFTQANFAHDLGVSESYIQAIELGQRAISDELAVEVSVRYGFTVESVKQVMGTPVSFVGITTSLPDALDAWKRLLEAFEGSELDAVLVEHYQRLMEVARSQGKTAITKLLLVRWLAATANKLEHGSAGSGSQLFAAWAAMGEYARNLNAVTGRLPRNASSISSPGRRKILVTDFASYLAKAVSTSKRGFGTPTEAEK